MAKYLRALAVTAGLLFAGLIAATALTLDSTSPLATWLPIPNLVGYYFHAAAGNMLNRLGASPEDTAIQWVKAASHARTSEREAEAVHGIALARARDTETSHAYFDTTLCAIAHRGSPFTIATIQQSGIHCTAVVLYRFHVPEGAPIIYDSRPPIGGPHYDKWYPHYGVVSTPILPGYWVHNLEHGAIVLLYNCPSGCPDLVDQIQTLYPQLPLGHNASPGAARLIALPYSNMGHRLAVVAWDHLLELDGFDRSQIIAFYERFLDRGPECINLQCPQ